MNLLVTGGAGFIGSNLIRHIINESEVSRLVNLDCLTYAGHLENLSDLESRPKYTFEQVDLRNKSGVAEVVRRHEITHVVHLAAESHVDRSIVGPDDFIQTNVVGTFYLLEACRGFWGGNFAGRRFLHVSTDEVYGSLGSAGKFTEETPYAPNSPYSASKASSDMLVRSYHHTYRLPALITNCSNNYGPYQFPEKLLPVVARSAIWRRSIPVYGDGMNVRDWLFVLDHAEALWRVLRNGRTGQTYNIGGNNEINNRTLTETILRLMGKKWDESVEYVKDRPGHDRRYAIDAGKTERELSWQPQHRFERAIAETIRWYQENQKWWRAIKTGEYLKYYDTMYGKRA